MVVDSAAGGRTSYRNASSTLRRGAELSFESSLGKCLSARATLTLLRATYESGFGNVQAGIRLPGVPPAHGYAELAWKDPAGRIDAAVETIARTGHIRHRYGRR